jgi:hypothetical protein
MLQLIWTNIYFELLFHDIFIFLGDLLFFLSGLVSDRKCKESW